MIGSSKNKYKEIIIDLLDQLHRVKKERETYRELYFASDEREGIYIDRMEAAMAIIDSIEVSQPELYTQIANALYPPYMDNTDYILAGEKCGDEREENAL